MEHCRCRYFWHFSHWSRPQADFPFVYPRIFGEPAAAGLYVRPGLCDCEFYDFHTFSLLGETERTDRAHTRDCRRLPGGCMWTGAFLHCHGCASNYFCARCHGLLCGRFFGGVSLVWWGSVQSPGQQCADGVQCCCRRNFRCFCIPVRRFGRI